MFHNNTKQMTKPSMFQQVHVITNLLSNWYWE